MGSRRRRCGASQKFDVLKRWIFVVRDTGRSTSIRRMRNSTGIAAALLAAVFVASCGGGGGGSPPEAPPPAIQLLDFSETAMAVIKVRSSLNGVTLLEEKLTSLLESGPQRRITLLDQRGAVRARYSPPPGSSLIDFAQHASGEMSVALATARTVTLVRLDRAAAVSTEFPLLDPQAASDPFYDAGGVHDD